MASKSKSPNNAFEGFLSFHDLETPEKMKEVASKELGETEQLKQKCLQEMKTLIKEHKVACITRDDFLLRFLRTKKFNVPRAFVIIQNHVRQRAALHKRLMKLRPEVMETCLRRNIIGFLPYRDAEERPLFFCAMGRWNANICTDEEIATVVMVLASYGAEKESAQVTGAHVIFDCTDMSLVQLPVLLRHVYWGYNFLFRSLPVRYKELHHINEPYLLKYFDLAVYPFLSEKTKSRIIRHGETRDAFFEVFPRSIIPEEYGGTLGPLNNDHLIDPILDYLQKMKDEQQYYLRPEDLGQK